MEAFIKVITEDPKVRVEINDVLDRNMRIPPKCQSKIGFDTLIQNVILEELKKIMGTAITDLDIELKKKISRIKYLEKKSW